MATGTIKNAVNHSDLATAKTEIEGLIDDATEAETQDVSGTLPIYSSSVERISLNSCFYHRFGRMVSLNVCFNVSATGVAAGSGVFGFPDGCVPMNNVFCLLVSSTGTAVPTHLESINGVLEMVADGTIPQGFYRGILTYVTQPEI